MTLNFKVRVIVGRRVHPPHCHSCGFAAWRETKVDTNFHESLRAGDISSDTNTYSSSSSSNSNSGNTGSTDSSSDSSCDSSNSSSSNSSSSSSSLAITAMTTNKEL
uniref:Uncharacterized protein n=1 Tax=Vespula pensylvanica TaxID=30213 RepID=A0A834NRB9_VESPE|nr:hypothetical protein H0235_011102 [Vespula pensylvanica]